ncbi:MAG: hypothetical protein WCT04_00905 [Planctomycetota bacterium]
MKDWIIEFLDAQLGRVLLVVALAWTGWSVYANWYAPVPKELTEAKAKPVYVEVDTNAKLQDDKEVYFASGGIDPYIVPGLFVFVPEKVLKQFTPVDLDIPPVSVKRPPQILPEPGPSLEGADKLPKFGDEFTPPSAADLAPPPKTSGPK